MTVKELYDYAVKHGLKNAKIILKYEAGDDWYSLDEEVEKVNLRAGDKELIIDFFSDFWNN